MKTLSCAVLVGVSTLASSASASTEGAEPIRDTSDSATAGPERPVDPILGRDPRSQDGTEASSVPGKNKLKLRVEILRDLSLDLHFIGQKGGGAGAARQSAFEKGVKKGAGQTVTDIKVSPNTTSAPAPTIFYSGGIVGWTRSAPGSTASNYHPPAPPSTPGAAGGPKPSAPPAASSDTDAPGPDRDRQGPGNNGGGAPKPSGSSAGADRDRQV
ncbi:MAG: hypothetical protein HOO96_36820, partial [Polyangiaceae bacterium]|nr:hypothetical protein [Polyangiaceae bacterium]